MRTLKLAVEVGIWDTEYTARVYHDHIVILTPYVKWEGNSGTLTFDKKKLPKQPDSLRYLSDDKIDAFWAWVGEQLGDSYLSNQTF